MNDRKKQKAAQGFHLTEENSLRLIKYVASCHLDGNNISRSKVVNNALDSFFERKTSKIQLEKIA